MTGLKLLGTAAALAFAGSAHAAETFHLTYTTFADSTSGPAVTVNATITAEGSGFGDNGFFVTGISGTRGSEAISFNDNFDEIFFPGQADGTIVDGFGLTFFAGGLLYNFYRNGAGDFAYHEFENGDPFGVGRIVFANTVSLTRVDAVPEPASWAMMIAGFGIVGGTARYRMRRTKIAYA